MEVDSDFAVVAALGNHRRTEEEGTGPIGETDRLVFEDSELMFIPYDELHKEFLCTDTMAC
jgi:hypothetical protein